MITMHTLQRLVCMLLMSLMLVSCKKDDEPLTHTQQLIKTLQEVIKTRNVQRVIAVANGRDWSDYPTDVSYGKKYKFSNPFIIISTYSDDDVNYNLDKLINYRLLNTNNDGASLYLYF
jgi:hypothetical protein